MLRWVLAALWLVGCGNGRTPETPPVEPVAPAPERAMVKGLVAHRGASAEAPENTLAALRRGWELGAESCEIDVRLSRDGAVVLIHDDTTKRTGGVDRKVSEQTLAELKQLDVGAWKAERYRGERIPTLKEAIEAIPPGRQLFVELKDGVESAAPVAAVIREARAGSIALQAYDPRVLKAVAELLPGVPAYWTVDMPADGRGGGAPYPAELATAGAGFGFAGLALDYRGVTDDFIAQCARAGILLDVWTVNDAAALRTWLTRVRFVETDHPGG